MENTFQERPATADSGGMNVDIKRVLFRALRFWYLIVLSVLVALIIAFLKNRYSTKIYPVSASLIVREAEDFSGPELIYNNPLINFRRNYLNEPYILKSRPLVQQVVEDLNFDVAFFKEGNVLTSEVYGTLPIIVKPLREKMSKNYRFLFTVIDQSQFALQDVTEEFPAKNFNFNDTISYAGFSGAFRLVNLDGFEEVKDTPLQFHYTLASELTDQYINQLNVEWAEEGAGVIKLSISGPSPEKQQDFLQRLIYQYQANDLAHKNLAAARTVDFITEQLDVITDSLRRVERQLQRFKNQNVITDLSGEALRLYEKVEALEAEQAKLAISKNYYKYLTEYIQNGRDLQQIILPSSIGIADPVLTALVSRMNEIQLDIKMSTKANNPLVEEGVKRISQMKNDIVEAVQNQKSTDEIKLNFLNKQIKEIEKQLSLLPLAEQTLVSIQRNYALQENLYIFLLQRRSEAAITQASNTSDISVVNPAQYGAPVAPRPKLNYMIALMLGITLPFIAFAVVEIFDDRVQSKEDIEKLTRIPFIGGVGHKKSDSNLAVVNEPKSALAESFRALRSNLNFFIGNRSKGIFMVTSSISGEGKTFTSINLATVMAMSGKKTLIVGADLRKPKIYSDFGLLNERGLSNFLANLSPFDEIVQTTKIENLDFVTAGPVPPNPSELLLSTRMTEFMELCKGTYDFVIIDTPPLAVVTDAFVISPYADHILFLVRQNYTPKELLSTAEDFYATGKLKNISIVLNDIYRSGPGYGYGYSYAYGYGYGYGYGYIGRKANHDYYR